MYFYTVDLGIVKKKVLISMVFVRDEGINFSNTPMGDGYFLLFAF